MWSNSALYSITAKIHSTTVYALDHQTITYRLGDRQKTDRGRGQLRSPRIRTLEEMVDKSEKGLSAVTPPPVPEVYNNNCRGEQTPTISRLLGNCAHHTDQTDVYHRKARIAVFNKLLKYAPRQYCAKLSHKCVAE